MGSVISALTLPGATPTTSQVVADFDHDNPFARAHRTLLTTCNRLDEPPRATPSRLATQAVTDDQQQNQQPDR